MCRLILSQQTIQDFRLNIKKLNIFSWNSNSKFQVNNNTKLSWWWNEITIAVRFQVSNLNNMRNEFSNSNSNYYTSTIFQNWNVWIYYRNNSYDLFWWSSRSEQLYNANERHLYWQTIKANWKIKVFLDWVKVWEKDMLSTLRWSGADWYQYIWCGRNWYTNYFSWKQSRMIAEKVERSENFFLKYFNKTKSIYWL